MIERFDDLAKADGGDGATPADPSPGSLAEDLQAILDHSPDGILLAKATDGTLIAANDTAERLLGRSADDLIGNNHLIIHPPDEHDRAASLFNEVGAAGNEAVSTYEDGSQIHIERPSGETIPVEINVSRKSVYDTEIVQGHFRDISTRLDQQRDLAVFREAVERSGHSIFITDRSGQIEYVNPAFERISGYSRSEAVGERPSILKSGVHDSAFYQRLWTTILSGDVWEGELVNETKDGERYHIEQTIAPILGSNDEIEHFVAVNNDITERRERAKQLLWERERLREFAETVAHDLRTPLSVAIGHLDLAEERTQDSSIEDALEALERMRGLIDELLELSSQGLTVDTPEPVNVVEAAERAWELVNTHNASLTLAVDADWTNNADQSRLVQLLQNLFDNAIRHGGDTVRIHVEQLSTRQGFAVADDGPGIDLADRARVFDSGVSLSGGTGYGLSIVKQITRAHGWEIVVVQDQDLGGARFEIYTDPLSDNPL